MNRPMSCARRLARTAIGIADVLFTLVCIAWLRPTSEWNEGTDG